MSTGVAELVAEARQAWLAEDFDSALDKFREATSKTPEDSRLCIEFANYLGMRFEVTEALDILGRCEQDLANHGPGLYQVGLAYERAYSPSRALRCFEQAVNLNPQHFGAIRKIAEWYERRGMIDDAEAAIADVPGESPDLALVRARLLRRRGELTAAATILETLTNAETASAPDTAIHAWYELARLHDATQEYDRAFEAACSAKKLQRRDAATHLRRAQELVPIESNFVSTVTESHYRRWAKEAEQQPRCLLTGSPRSGTTLMARALGEHPSVDLADELDVYSTYVHPRLLRGLSGNNAGEALDSISASRLQRCRKNYDEWMRAALPASCVDRVLLDKNPSTTFLIPAFRRLFPRSVVIMSIRDPRDVIVSCFLQHLPLNPVSAMFTRMDLTVMRCRAELEAWAHLRKRLTQPWCELRYEEIACGNDQSLATAISTMQLPSQSNLLNFRRGLQKNAVRSPTYAELFEPVHGNRIGRWQRYAKHLERFLPSLDPILEEFGY